MTAGVWTIVVAAGSGTRFGGAKQYEVLGNRRVVDWAVETASLVSDGVVLVVPAGERVGERVGEPGDDECRVKAVVPGGATRAASVRAGLAAVPAEATVVVVHDAARPLASVALFRSVVAAVGGGAGGPDGAVPGLALADTVKRVDSFGAVVETLDRSQLVAIQTPQAFATAALRRAHAAGGDATDDAALVEAVGGRVVVVEGERENVKLTRPSDLALARALLLANPDPHADPPSVPAMRVGVGFDAHPFTDEPGRPLLLGGVELEFGRSLAGHSDGDALAHAVADALLGAAGLGDIGTWFPDTDSVWSGADSIDLLARVVAQVAGAGWRTSNVDCAVALDAPRLAPHRHLMEARLTEVVGAPVSVKAKRGEGMGGALEAGDGVACWAVALIERP